MADIGSIIFVDILKMTSYPGSPFTGNIINDLIMFLFIPSIFIIAFIYILLWRMNIPHAGIRLLMGLAIYAYIIVSGFYDVFALAVGPYFFVLIFILGGFYFLTNHFRVRGHTHGSSAALEESGHARYTQFENMSRRELRIAKERIENEISFISSELKEAERTKNQERIEQLRVDRARARAELAEINAQLDIIGKATHGWGI